MGDKKNDVPCTVPTTRSLRFIFSSVFSSQFSKISQTIEKRNDLVCNDLVVGTVFKILILNGNNKKYLKKISELSL